MNKHELSEAIKRMDKKLRIYTEILRRKGFEGLNKYLEYERDKSKYDEYRGTDEYRGNHE